MPSQPKPKSTSTPPQAVRTSNPAKAISPPAISPPAHPPVVVASQPLITAKSGGAGRVPSSTQQGRLVSAYSQAVHPRLRRHLARSLSSSTPSAVPSRNLSDAAAAMIASNAQTRASKTQQLRDTLKKGAAERTHCPLDS